MAKKMSLAQIDKALVSVDEAYEAILGIKGLIYENSREDSWLPKRYRVLLNKISRFRSLLQNERGKRRVTEGYYRSQGVSDRIGLV